MLERQVEFLLGRFAAADVAVSIQPGWEERCRALSKGVHWTVVDPEATPLGALKALLKAAPLRDWGFVHHVDMPVWEAGLFEALERRLPGAEAEGVEALAPVKDGRKGHPVVLSARLAGELSKLDAATERLDFWLRGRREATVDVPYESIHQNWNQPRK